MAPVSPTSRKSVLALANLNQANAFSWLKHAYAVTYLIFLVCMYYAIYFCTSIFLYLDRIIIYFIADIYIIYYSYVIIFIHMLIQI